MSIEIGAVTNGKQTFTIGNPATGRCQTVISTPERVDEFVRQYEETEKKAGKRTLWAMVLPALAGLAGGIIKHAKLAGIGIGLLAGGVLGMISARSGAKKLEKMSNEFINENTQQ